MDAESPTDAPIDDDAGPFPIFSEDADDAGPFPIEAFFKRLDAEEPDIDHPIDEPRGLDEARGR